MRGIMLTDDNALVNGILKNDRRAYNGFMEKYHRFILFICDKACPNIQDADEIANDIELKIFGKIGSYDPHKGSLKPWINRVALNHLRDCMKKNAFCEYEKSLEEISEKECAGDNEYLDDNGAYPDQNVTVSLYYTEQHAFVNDDKNEYFIDCLKNALKILSDRDRIILQLKADGFDYEEIAGLLKINYKTVTTAYGRAMARIKTRFEELTALKKAV